MTKKRQFSFFVLMFGALLLSSVPALAQNQSVSLRVLHASPDAPAVNLLVDGAIAFSGVTYEELTAYQSLTPGSYNIQVVPVDGQQPVIEANLDLTANTDYTVAAVGQVANIEPLVLVDDNTAPPPAKGHVRFVHTASDAPAVNIAVQNGPVLFSNVAFKGISNYQPVDPGSYTLEVRVSGDVVLTVPAVNIGAGKVYSVFALGLTSGQPALSALASLDASVTTPGPTPGDQQPADPCCAPPQTDPCCAPPPPADPCCSGTEYGYYNGYYPSVPNPYFDYNRNYYPQRQYAVSRYNYNHMYGQYSGYNYYHQGYIRPYSSDGMYQRPNSGSCGEPVCW